MSERAREPAMWTGVVMVVVVVPVIGVRVPVAIPGSHLADYMLT